MNDTADQPPKRTSAEPEFRKVSDEELQRILANHEQWLAAEDKTGLDHLRADLSRADLVWHGAILGAARLQEANLSEAQLSHIQLQGAKLTGAQLWRARLQQADLSNAELQGANLAGAQLSWANLAGAQLQEARLPGAQLLQANLKEAQLQRADFELAELPDANLIGAQLQNTKLTRAQLQRADLRRAQLQEADLYGAVLNWVDFEGAQLQRANLGFAQLQRAHLVDAHLQGVSLFQAQLQDADLSRAELQKASLEKAQLQGADLHAAQLKEANLSQAQLQGASLQQAELEEAQLSKAQLQGAKLIGAQLQRAHLSFAQLQQADLSGAQLEGANLLQAQLQGAYLLCARLREADLTGANFDGEPGWDLPAADLTDADFRDADLSNSQLSTVTGLRAEKLAGAVLTNAKLPDDIKKFDKLTHVAETSRNASTIFFGLIAASLYSWLTIATTTDVALITGTASSPLPIINTNIALSGFYLAAPLILIAVYFYFHLYLQRLWRGLASLPAVFPDGEALDNKAYPWLLNGLVRKHFKNLALAERPLTRWENFVSILLAWWVVPLTLLAFWLRFLPRHDWLGTTLHVALIAGAAWFGVHSYQLAVRTLRAPPATENRGDQPLLVRLWHTIRRYRPGGMEAAGFGVGIVLALSVDTATKPGDDLLTALGSGLGYETYADLTDDDISTKPSGWTGREETAGVEIAQVKGADLEGRNLRNADASGAFLVRSNLSYADLRGAKLGGADLRGAVLQGADLRGAYFRTHEVSVLWGLVGFSGYLRGADLSGADLRGADLRGVLFLTQAQLNKACGDPLTRLPQGRTIRRCDVTAPPASPSPHTGSS